MTQQHQKKEQGAEPLPTEPGHVMAREHYERLAREAAAQQQK
ncbi:hypothetical protein [Duganella aquatilis]|nr:hypothetical protein [Duganella aquatilis]